MFPLHSEMPYIKEDGKRSTLGEMLDQESSDISDLKSRMTTAEGDIDTLEGKMSTAESDIDNLESDVSDLSDAISDAFDNTKTYAVGDYFIYEDTIYEVITACTDITPPNAEYYTSHNVTDLITTLNSSLSKVNSGYQKYTNKLVNSVGTTNTTLQEITISETGYYMITSMLRMGAAANFTLFCLIDDVMSISNTESDSRTSTYGSIMNFGYLTAGSTIYIVANASVSTTINSVATHVMRLN